MYNVCICTVCMDGWMDVCMYVSVRTLRLFSIAMEAIAHLVR